MYKEKLDYDNPVLVYQDIYWLGYYDKENDFRCNPYIMIDGEDKILFDPGSIPHFPIVMRKIIDLINPEDITKIVVSHQDPDVCGNLAIVEDIVSKDDLKIVTHSTNTRLLDHLGIQSDYYVVDKHNYMLTLKSGRVLEFIYTPYLHSPFGIITYDTKTKTLFSADIFGALSEDWELFDRGNFLHKLDKWHQLIAASERHLRFLMDRLEKMDIQRILPQHGSIIEGADVRRSIEYLKNLRCGIDLMEFNNE